MKKHMFFRVSLTILLMTAVQGYAYEKHSIDWPTKISESEHKIGPLLHQFQQFSDSYFHEGVDILTPQGQLVFSPVGGLVDAGYYSYKTLPSGLSEKTYISIRDIDENDKEPKLWGERYFEVSITDPQGNRFEIHHIKRESMSAAIRNAVHASLPIDAGLEIGTVVEWHEKVRGTDYNHIHYSILNSEGLYLNPFWYSSEIADTVAPVINSVYASVSKRCSANGLRQLKELSQLNDSDDVTHIVVLTQDHLGNNSFPQPPTVLNVSFSDGTTFTFDYSDALFTNEFNSYTLDEIYVGRFCIGAADFPFVLPGSENFKFYIQVPVPEDFRGSIEIAVSDFSNNTTIKTVEL